MNEEAHMTVEKKVIRSDIPGHHTSLHSSARHVSPATEETSRLVVARNISLSGEISACENLVVEGAINAPAFRARRLEVAEGGLFVGTADVQDAVISGKFEGRLSVPGRLTVKSTGRIQGEVSYGTLEVEGGGKIEGQLLPLVLHAPVEIPALESAAKKKLQPVDNVENLFDMKSVDPERKSPRVFRRTAGD
jgi:cytoskeletal protein CcmA (bactofilin family)